MQSEDEEEKPSFNESMSVKRKSILRKRRMEEMRDNSIHEHVSCARAPPNLQPQQMNQPPGMFERSYRALNHGGYRTQLATCFHDSGHHHFGQSFQRLSNCGRGGDCGQFGRCTHHQQQPYQCQPFGQSFQSCCHHNAMPPFAQSYNVLQPGYRHPTAQTCMHQQQPAAHMGEYNYHHLDNAISRASPARSFIPSPFHGFGGSQNIPSRGQLPRRGLPCRIPVRMPVRKSEKKE